MPLPKKIRDAEEQSEALYKKVYETQSPEVPPVETPPEPANEVAPEPTPDGSQVEEQQPVADSEETWENRFKVLTGKYSSEVPRLAAEKRELKSQLKQMQEELEVLKKGQPSESKLIKPEEVEEYGEPLIDLIKRAAREEVAAKNAEIAELKAKIDSFDTRTTKVVEVDFYDQLHRNVPDWVAINEDKAFHQWLEGHDDLTGQRRQDLLVAAEQDRDAKRVSNFFLAFKKAGQSWAATASKKLESQVVPETSNISKPPVGKKIWTVRDIDNFYNAVRKNEISDKDAVAIEAEIHAAQIEGRIR